MNLCQCSFFYLPFFWPVLRRILESDSASCQISPSTTVSWSRPSKHCLEWDQLSHSVSVVRRTYRRPTYRRPNPLNWIFISSAWISISWIFNYLYDRQCLPNVRSAHLFTFFQAVVLIRKYSSADLMHFFFPLRTCAVWSRWNNTSPCNRKLSFEQKFCFKKSCVPSAQNSNQSIKLPFYIIAKKVFVIRQAGLFPSKWQDHMSRNGLTPTACNTQIQLSR